MRCSMKSFLIILAIPLVLECVAAQDSLRYANRGTEFYTENHGQWNSELLYASLNEKMAVGFTKNGFHIFTETPASLHTNRSFEARSSDVVSRFFGIEFKNSSERMRVRPIELLRNPSHFYAGGDTSRWFENVSNYAGLRYENVWDGVDFLCFDDNGTTRYGFSVANYDVLNSIVCEILEESGNRIVISKSELSPATVSLPISFQSDSLQAIATKLFIFDFEFGTYYGFSGHEVQHNLCLDNESNIYFTGTTYSSDFDFVNPLDSTFYYYWSVVYWHSFLSSITPDGATIRFSTFLPGTLSTDGDARRALSLSNNNTIWYFGTVACSRDSGSPPQRVEYLLPLTPDAQYTTCVDFGLCFLEFTANGHLNYSSYFRDTKNIDFGEYFELKFIFNDTAIISFNIDNPESDPIPFLSNGSFRDTVSSPRSSELCLLKYDIKSDSVYFCAFINKPGRSETWINDLEVDSQGNIVIVGTQAPQVPPQIPLVNSMSSDPGKGSFIMKIDKDAKNILFSTFSPTPGYTILNDVEIDDEDNIHIAGTGDSHYLHSYVNPLPSPFLTQSIQYNGSDQNTHGVPLYLQLTPDGDVNHITTYSGDSSTQYLGNGSFLHLDPCGNVYLFNPRLSRGQTVFPRYQAINAPYLTVLDSGISTVLFSSSILPTAAYPGSGIGTWDPSAMYHDGSFYYAVPETGMLYELPTSKNAYQPEVAGSTDIYIGMMHLPLCNRTENCELLAPDTLRLIRQNGSTTPPVFSVNFALHNGGPLPLETPLMELETASAFTILQPGGTTAVPSPAPIMPNDTGFVQWLLALDTSIVKDTLLDIRALATYTFPPDSGSLVICRKNIFIDVVELPEYKLSCSVLMPDTITVEENDYSINPVPIEINLQNTGMAGIEMGYMVLRYGRGLGIELHPIEDTIRTLDFIGAKQEHTETFLFNLARRSNERYMQIEIIAYDRYGQEVTRCFPELYVPPVQGLFCTTLCPDTVVYYQTTGISVPSPITVSLELRNDLDTAQRSTVAEIDLLSLQELQLVAGYPQRQSRFIIDANGTTNFSWQMEVVPPVTDMKTVSIPIEYYSVTDSTRRICTCELTLKPLNPDAVCSIDGLDALTVEQNTYTPNPFTLDYRLLNNGSGTLAVTEIEILLPDYIIASESTTQPASPLSAGSEYTFTWNLTAKTSMYARDAIITVIAKDADGATLSTCTHTIYLPPVEPIECISPEEFVLNYDKNAGRYVPDPLSLNASFTNLLDTTLVNVEVKLDLSKAPNVVGTVAVQSLGDIGPADSRAFVWMLTFTEVDVQTTDTVQICYRVNGGEWKCDCYTLIVIPPAIKTYSAICQVGGHDSLFIDHSGEIVVPVPLQVWYTITNTGSGTLTNCEATIQLPNELSLYPGESAAKSYGVIERGESITKTWSLLPAASPSIIGRHEVQWTFTSTPEAENFVDCKKTIIGQERDDVPLQVSAKRLYFEALQDGPLPAEQIVDVYAGPPSAMPWTMQGYDSWLDVDPNTSPTHEQVSVQPNTTSLGYGVHTTSIDIASPTLTGPAAIEVYYTIYQTTSTPDPQSATAFALGVPYPNPASSTISVPYTLQSNQTITLTLYDTYGRTVRTISGAPNSPGKHLAQFNAAGLPAGNYYIVLQSGTERQVRAVVVRR